MRICYHCGRLTAGHPLFCTTCGRSYNAKLCPRLHPNSRAAEACSQCGSRDLSTPQERLPLWFVPLVFLAGMVPGAALLLISVLYVGYFLDHLVRDPSALLVPMLWGLLLGFVWLLWIHVPFILVRLLRLRRLRKERK
jgi:hypothetical protein